MLKIYGTNFIPRSEMNEIQNLEEKRSQLRAQMSEGRNWVVDYDKMQNELKQIDEKIRVLETIAAHAELEENLENVENPERRRFLEGSKLLYKS